MDERRKEKGQTEITKFEISNLKFEISGFESQFPLFRFPQDGIYLSTFCAVTCRALDSRYSVVCP